MLANDLFNHDEYGDVFTETDRLLVDASLRLARRMTDEPIETSEDLYRALLILAKAVRNNHAAIDLEPTSFGRLLEETWTVRDEQGEFEFTGDHLDATALIEALCGADPALIGRSALEDDSISASGAPIVLSTIDDVPRFATIRRYACAESAIAQRLLASATTQSTTSGDGAVLPEPSQIVAKVDASRVNDEVSTFLERAVTRSISVLTGGPGTGKTTAVATLLKAMGELAKERGAPYRVAICAPTAKAAVRMREALDGAMGGRGLAEYVEDLLVDPKSGSVHSLLGIRPDASISSVELACDLVVVDEVSMLEMTLLDQLLRCVGDSHVLLVGDPDQLVSVQVGAVLRDIVAAGETPGSPLEGIVTRLVTTYRSNDAIVALARAIDEGSLEQVEATIAAHPEVLRRMTSPSGEVEAVIAQATDIRTAAQAGDIHRSLQLLGQQVVLCANREGDWSVAWWRQKVADQLARSDEDWSRTVRFAVGTPLMILKNEQSATRAMAERLANGDVGVVVETPDGPEAFFLPDNEEPRHRQVRMIDQADPAWSFTIHKSQGSEYDRVVVSLPPKKNRILSKELLYTAVTRAKHQVVIVGSDEVLSEALGREVSRVSSLTERLESASR